MPEEPRSVWDDQYDGWKDAYRHPPNRIRRLTRRAPVRWLHRWARLGEGSRVLEAGCGGGAFGIALALMGCEVTLLDYAPAAAESTRRNIEAVEQRGGVTLNATVRCDDLLAPREGRLIGFDLVFNVGVIEHIREYEGRAGFVRAMAAAARQGGHVAAAVPNNCHPWAEKWRRQGFPWLQEGHRLQEVAISREELLRTLEDAGLADARMDGYAVPDTLLKWPKRRWLEYPVRGLARIGEMPFPRATRVRWGTWWLGMAKVGPTPGPLAR
jgi:2-polyprenyl-3-methyl-5-hydroxy-6-metoxy-1,4-benzoquinol methylase